MSAGADCLAMFELKIRGEEISSPASFFSRTTSVLMQPDSLTFIVSESCLREMRIEQGH